MRARAMARRRSYNSRAALILSCSFTWKCISRRAAETCVDWSAWSAFAGMSRGAFSTAMFLPRIAFVHTGGAAPEHIPIGRNLQVFRQVESERGCRPNEVARADGRDLPEVRAPRESGLNVPGPPPIFG